MPSFVSAVGLSKIYTRDYAVKDLSFTVNEGEVFGFLGPNGAGKTTTLRMMCGILDPTEGKCTIKGFDTVDDRIKVKEITGYLPEEDFLYGEMTVRDHLKYMAELYSVKNDVERVRETLQLVDMESHGKDIIKTLSKGQRRRVAIAKTLIHDPQLVLLDEVTSGLDPVYARRMTGIVKDLRKKGKTVVFSTHLMDEATELCDRILVIHKGRLMACDTIPRILEDTGTGSLKDAFFKLVGDKTD
ncbi:MAG: ABC transporter ATP-binding protein [Candidatus Altiarchaeota archaeon]